MAKEKKKEKEKKKNKPKKRIFLKILLVLVGIIVIYMAYSFIKEQLTPIAVLIVNSGTAEVKSASGEWKTATSGMALKEGMSIKTLSGSKAIVVLRDSSVTRLDENTEITLTNLNKTDVSIIQAAGQTWTRLLKFSGISGYEIETSDALATVRGTAFAVSVGNGTQIGVLEGTVHTLTHKLENNFRTIISSIDIHENNSVDIDPNKLELKDLKVISLLRTKWIDENDEKDKQYIAELRDRLIQRYSMQLNYIKTKYNWTDEQLKEYVVDYMKGKHSIKKEIEAGNVPQAVLILIPEELKRY
jgi:hypothetical protein